MEGSPAGITCSPRVLVADDEALIADTLAAILNHFGFEALAVYSGEAALEKSHQWHPGTLLIDVQMSGMSGVDAGILIGRELPQCRFVYLTGQSMPSHLVDRLAKSGQAFAILVKPVHPTALVAYLRTGFALAPEAESPRKRVSSGPSLPGAFGAA